MPQVARVEEQLCVRAAVAFPRRAERNAVQAAGEPLGDRQELERAERLEHDRVGARRLRCTVRIVVRARQEHDRDVACLRVVLELAAELEPVRARHLHVEDDHARVLLADLPPRTFGVLGDGDVDVRNLERRSQELQ